MSAPAGSHQPPLKPVKLELNNSGAWKTVARFDAADLLPGLPPASRQDGPCNGSTGIVRHWMWG